jgi:CheY-like chemotaxis protein
LGWGAKAVLTNCRILVVEDETMIALDLVAILEREHGRILGLVQTVAEALQLLPHVQLDCALLDINLRGETAFAIADALKDTGVPFAFVTGYMDSAVPERHRDRRIIRKPFVASEVIKTVARLLPDLVFSLNRLLPRRSWVFRKI